MLNLYAFLDRKTLASHYSDTFFHDSVHARDNDLQAEQQELQAEQQEVVEPQSLEGASQWQQ